MQPGPTLQQMVVPMALDQILAFVDRVRGPSNIPQLQPQPGGGQELKWPTTYQGERILARVPYTIAGELILAAGSRPTVFDAGVFTLASDLPFEVHRLIPKAAQSVAAPPAGVFLPIAAPAPGINEWWRLRVKALSINQDVTQNAQLVSTMVAENTGWWEWDVPLTIRNQQGFVVTAETLLPVNFLRAAVTFEGFLIVTNLPGQGGRSP